MNLSIPLGYYATTGITASTNVRDVSEVLDLWAHRETPFLNRISWGAESGGLVVEWLSENLGWRYIETSTALGSADTVFICGSTGTGAFSTAEQTKQIRVGTLLYVKGVAAAGALCGDHGWFLVSTIGASYSVTGAWVSGTKTSLAASGKMYIVGSFANEGSTPDRDTSRARSLLSNKMTILRYDIQITGSEAATDMWAVGDELAHQKAMRLLEMQKDRELSILLGYGQTRAATTVGLMAGVANYMITDLTAGASNVDHTTTTLTKSAVNNLVAAMAELGHKPNVAVGSYTQIRKFTGWDEARIRSRPDDRVGGEWVNSFLCDTGIELDLLPLMQFPSNWLMILDTNNISLRAKKGRKLLLQKLGLAGDYEQWQLLSEYSCEFRRGNQNAFGGFDILT